MNNGFINYRIKSENIKSYIKSTKPNGQYILALYIFSLFILLSSSLLFSDYGPATYVMTDTIIISGHGTGNFTLIAPSNTSFQKVIIAAMPQGLTYNSGHVYGQFNLDNISSKTYIIKYNISVDYTHLKLNGILNDESGPKSASSKINKILDIVNNVYNSFSYNANSDDYKRSISDILYKKTGSCVAYSRAANYMLHDQGFNDLKYAYGFSYSTGVYHLWLYYPDYDLEIDPTYGEVGLLENDHIIFGYVDKPRIIDLETKYFGDINISHSMKVNRIHSSKFMEDIECNFVYKNNSILLTVVNNDPTKFMFRNIGTFSSKSIKGPVFYKDSYRIPLHMGNYKYVFNLSAKYNDIVCSKSLEVDNRDKISKVADTNWIYYILFGLIAIVILYIIFSFINGLLKSRNNDKKNKKHKNR